MAHVQSGTAATDLRFRLPDILERGRLWGFFVLGQKTRIPNASEFNIFVYTNLLYKPPWPSDSRGPRSTKRR